MGENIPVPPKRKRRDNEEHRSQAALCVWWHHACAGFGVPEHHLLAIPNGGWRDPVGMVFLKREGLRNGCPDLFLAVGRRDKLGLWIEMKTATGVLSTDQDKFILSLRAHGYEAYACHSCGEAMKTITGYLNGEESI